jgi:hypothetical protein
MAGRDDSCILFPSAGLDLLCSVLCVCAAQKARKQKELICGTKNPPKPDTPMTCNFSSSNIQGCNFYLACLLEYCTREGTLAEL